MTMISDYQQYAQLTMRQHVEKDSASRYMLVDAVENLDVKRVLDIGCGAGMEMLPFVERKNACCFGIDIGEELGIIGQEVKKGFDFENKLNYLLSMGEELPFEDGSFDVVLCRISLPYMHNKKTIAEVSRVLRSGGVFLLKTHSLMFFVDLLKRRIKTLNPKKIAFPLLCIFNGTVHILTGKQFYKDFWNGKQVYQTKGFLTKEFLKNNMKIEGTLPDDNVLSPSFLIVKS